MKVNFVSWNNYLFVVTKKNYNKGGVILLNIGGEKIIEETNNKYITDDLNSYGQCNYIRFYKNKQSRNFFYFGFDQNKLVIYELF